MGLVRSNEVRSRWPCKVRSNRTGTKEAEVMAVASTYIVLGASTIEIIYHLTLLSQQ